MPFDYGALHAKTQLALIDFLHTTLEASLTFVRSAEIADSDGHLDHHAQAKQSAIKSADAVRRFISQVSDSAIQANIAGKLAELDRLIGTL